MNEADGLVPGFAGRHRGLGIVDEIAGRAPDGAKVLGVRTADIPSGTVAAIPRHWV